MGGPDESFGNLLVEFERATIAVRVVRDRSQWFIDIAPPGSRFVGLHVLLTAKDGVKPKLRDHRAGMPLPESLPEGVRWTVAVPAVVSWLEQEDAMNTIDRAERQWSAAMRPHLG